MQRLHCASLLVLAVAVASPAAAATTFHVGPTQTYTKVSAAVTAASAGDVIEIDPGTYYRDAGWATIGKSNLTIRGVGATRPILDADGQALSNKGIFTTTGTGTGVTIENIEFRNCSTYDKAGAGIRQEAANLTVRNCCFRGNNQGIMTTNINDLLVEYSEFDHNGTAGGLSHGINVGTANSFTLRYCWVHNSVASHEVSSRAKANYILYNRISNESGTGLNEIFIGYGSPTYIIGNVIQQGPAGSDGTIISYATINSYANPYLYVINNTIVNDHKAGTFVHNASTSASCVALLQNNIFRTCRKELPDDPEDTILSGAGMNKTTLTSNWITNDARFQDVGNYDYHLTAASSGAIDAGSPPGTSLTGFSLIPVCQYIADCGTETRPVNGQIDIGAFEYTLANLPPVVDAGSDVTAVWENQEVSLHATASDPDNDPLVYAWVQTAGKTVCMTGITTASISFTTPVLETRADSPLTFQITVMDGRGGTATDTVSVYVYARGDANRDGNINVGDLHMVAAAWGSSQSVGATYSAGSDFNCDGYVNISDLQTLIARWGTSLD